MAVGSSVTVGRPTPIGRGTAVARPTQIGTPARVGTPTVTGRPAAVGAPAASSTAASTGQPASIGQASASTAQPSGQTASAVAGASASSYHISYAKLGTSSPWRASLQKAASAVAAAIRGRGQAAENELKVLGGDSQVVFKTPWGRRVVDQLADDIGNEAKSGLQYLTQSNALQIAKDAYLRDTGHIAQSFWHFFKNSDTGQGGPSKPLMKALDDADIPYVIY